MKCNDQINPFRFTDKTATVNERAVVESYWDELTNLYGTKTEYYIYGYQISAHNSVYGEHTTAPFENPGTIIVLAEMSNDSMLLSKFGIQTDADLTVVIPIKSFKEIFGINAEPKSGDLIKLSELGWEGYTNANQLSASNYCNTTENASTSSSFTSGYDSSWYLSGPIFIVTERRFINVPMKINFLSDVYVYLLHCKRFEYSYEPNAPRENRSDQVSDQPQIGKLVGGTLTPEPSSIGNPDVDHLADELFDYGNEGINTGIYGQY